MKERHVKICLMTSNIICLFIGLVTLACGLVLQFNGTVQDVLKSFGTQSSSTSIGILSIIMITVGALISFISFVGCCGAMSESKCMIGLYCVFLLLLLIGQITIGALGLYYGKEESTSLPSAKASYKIAFTTLMKSGAQSEKDILDNVQTFLECCGYDGPSDYTGGSQAANTTVASYSSTTTPIQIGDVTTTANINTSTTTTALPATTISTTTTTTTTTASTSVAPSTTSSIGNTTQQGPNSTMLATDASTTIATSESPTPSWGSSCCKKSGSKYTNETGCLDTSSPPHTNPYLHQQGCEGQIYAFVKKYAIIIGAVSLGFVLLEIISIIAGCSLYKSLD